MVLKVIPNSMSIGFYCNPFRTAYHANPVQLVHSYKLDKTAVGSNKSTILRVTSDEQVVRISLRDSAEVSQQRYSQDVPCTRLVAILRSQ